MRGGDDPDPDVRINQLIYYVLVHALAASEIPYRVVAMLRISSWL